MKIQQNNTNKWYTTILILSVLIPILYVVYLFLVIQGSEQSIEGFLNSQPIYAVIMLIGFINPIWGHFLNQIPKEERVRKGRGDRFLTFMLISQLVVGNIIMVILAFLAKRKLPSTSILQPLTTVEKLVAGVLLVLSLFAGFILLKLTIFS